MKVLLTGATGFIGTELVKILTGIGHSVLIVTRNNSKAKSHFKFQSQSKIEYLEHDLNIMPLEFKHFNSIDAIINLAGENIDGRWSKMKKNKILNSRLNAAKNILLNCPATVKTIITASAHGIYGDRENEELTEESSVGSGFLADVCIAWESDFKKLMKSSDKRIVILRFGMVMSHKDGALKKLESIFKKNFGAALGDGKQWISYISLNDLVRLILVALENVKYYGIINAVNNKPITNLEMTKYLCKKYSVICWPTIPEVILKVILGEMSNLALYSLKVIPKKLNELGFTFNDHNFRAIIDNNES